MSTGLRVVRAMMAVAIVVALVDQFFFGRDLPTFRAVNFFSYFTVLSNIFAAVLLLAQAARPRLVCQRTWSILRGAVTLYMAVTGIVYNVLLAPAAADVSTNLEWVNIVVHVVGPIVVVLDYLLDPPVTRPTVGETATWLVFPALWLVYTMVRGPAADWYPYPFLDPDLKSTASIVATCAAILIGLFALAAALRWWAGRNRARDRHVYPAG
jgi:hypothetical protein